MAGYEGYERCRARAHDWGLKEHCSGSSTGPGHALGGGGTSQGSWAAVAVAVQGAAKKWLCRRGKEVR